MSGESSASYLQALAEVATYDTTKGLVKIEQFTGGEAGRVAIQQNNVLIQLIINLHKRIDRLEAKLEGRSGQTSQGGADLANLIGRLEGLKISEKPQAKKGVFYAYKDPYKIFEEEKTKIRK